MPNLKLLPWLARRRGVALERAEELWRLAMARADFRARAGAPTGDYWGYAMRTLLKLLSAEGGTLAPAPAIDLEPPRRRPAVQLLASQHRLGTVAFDAAATYLRAANDLWWQSWRPRRGR